MVLAVNSVNSDLETILNNAKDGIDLKNKYSINQNIEEEDF